MSIVCLLGMCVIDTETMAAGPIQKRRGERERQPERGRWRGRERGRKRETSIQMLQWNLLDQSFKNKSVSANHYGISSEIAF